MLCGLPQTSLLPKHLSHPGVLLALAPNSGHWSWHFGPVGKGQHPNSGPMTTARAAPFCSIGEEVPSVIYWLVVWKTNLLLESLFLLSWNFRSKSSSLSSSHPLFTPTAQHAVSQALVGIRVPTGQCPTAGGLWPSMCCLASEYILSGPGNQRNGTIRY